MEGGTTMRYFIVMITTLAVLLISGCCHSGKREAVYGQMASKRIQMVQLLADQSFFMISDTIENRGSYSQPTSTEILFDPVAGEPIRATINGDMLRLGSNTLELWKGGTTAASYLAAFLKFRTLISTNRARIAGDIIALGRVARQFHNHSGSFKGFTIPEEYKTSDYAIYSVEVTPGQLIVKGSSTQVDGAIQATILPDGQPTAWIYFKYLM
jgi:hypothetical protein